MAAKAALEYQDLRGNTNILITSAGKRVTLTKQFQETLRRFYPEAKVFTTDMNPAMAPAGIVSDGCIAVPRVTDSGYIEMLLTICKEKGIRIIVPTIDTELLVLAENKELFQENGIEPMVSELPFIQACRDKRNTGTFLNSHDIRVPAPVDKYHPTFPLFAKPYDGSLSKDLYVVRGKEELTSEILNHPKLIFMEYIDKQEYKEFTVDMYYGKDNSPPLYRTIVLYLRYRQPHPSDIHAFLKRVPFLLIRLFRPHFLQVQTCHSSSQYLSWHVLPDAAAIPA